MKKLITILFFAALSIGAMAQSRLRGGASIGDHKVSGTNIEVVDSLTKTDDGEYAIYMDGDTIPPYTPVSFQVDGGTLYPELADTIPLVTFGVGAGLAADTALMNNGVLAGSFYNEGSDTLNITQLVGILKEGTGTETIAVQISWHATFLSGSATNLNASALAITSMTTGTIDTSFANAKIPPNVFVWCILSGASTDNKPTFLNVTLSGFKIPTY